MSNNKKENDFFSRSINAAFTLAAIQPEGMHYTPPEKTVGDEVPAFLRDQMNRKKKNDPWGNGWHGGFPPGAAAY
jgi:hypothetical protein